jgi:hypothetical protein
MHMSESVVRPSFVICVSEEGSEDLTAGMVYQVLPDETAGKEDFLRVIDDSGEDYLYPAIRFVQIAVPEGDEPRLLAVAHPGAA